MRPLLRLPALRTASLARTYALLSLLVIALISAVQVTVQWSILREDLLEWERSGAGEAIRADAYAILQPEDFALWREPASHQRFDAFFRRALFNPEILRVKIYDADMRVVWSDEPRLLGVRFPDNAPLREALTGRTVAHLERAEKAENVFERGFARTVELYVPLSFPGPAPGTARIAGVVEVYKDPARMFANITRDRLLIAGTSLGGALLLWAALFWIVHRASRQLQAQREHLECQTRALTTANEELRAAQAQLRASARLAALGEAAAAVAHGIRNPLANIRAAAQIAREADTDRQGGDRYLAAITEEVDRLGTWLRALLDTARPFEPRLVPAALDAVVEDTLGLLRERLERGGITVERRLASGLPPVRADVAHLQQALLSVLENAADALGGGGTLTVATALVPDGARPLVRLTVGDTGPGMPPEQAARVFDIFFTTKTRGTGLGLAIARRVVEAHGGAIDLTSAPGAGTTVRIDLPAAEATT